MSLQTLEDLFVEELHDLHSAEQQLVTVLPEMAEAARSDRLRRGFEEHVEQTRNHVDRLAQILQRAGRQAPDPASDVLEDAEYMLMPGYGEWVPVESSKASSRPRCAPLDAELAAAKPAVTSYAMQALIEESRKLIDQCAAPHVKDAGLVAEAQRIKHYEIAGYAAAHTHARLLGNSHAERLLQQNLRESNETNEKLTELAESEIHSGGNKT